ncbi:hypothetical protein [Embleya sp. NPDC001921]
MTASTAAAALPPRAAAAPADGWAPCDTYRETGISPYNPALDCPAGCCRGLVRDDEGDDE